MTRAQVNKILARNGIGGGLTAEQAARFGLTFPLPKSWREDLAQRLKIVPKKKPKPKPKWVRKPKGPGPDEFLSATQEAALRDMLH